MTDTREALLKLIDVMRDVNSIVVLLITNPPEDIDITTLLNVCTTVGSDLTELANTLQDNANDKT